MARLDWSEYIIAVRVWRPFAPHFGTVISGYVSTVTCSLIVDNYTTILLNRELPTSASIWAIARLQALVGIGTSSVFPTTANSRFANCTSLLDVQFCDRHRRRRLSSPAKLIRRQHLIRSHVIRLSVHNPTVRFGSRTPTHRQHPPYVPRLGPERLSSTFRG